VISDQCQLDRVHSHGPQACPSPVSAAQNAVVLRSPGVKTSPPPHPPATPESLGRGTPPESVGKCRPVWRVWPIPSCRSAVRLWTLWGGRRRGYAIWPWAEVSAVQPRPEWDSVNTCVAAMRYRSLPCIGHTVLREGSQRCPTFSPLRWNMQLSARPSTSARDTRRS
jgi:hypothetical protein